MTAKKLTRRVAFVQDLGTHTSIEADVVIALTPDAYEACLSRDLEVTVLDDHFNRNDSAPEWQRYIDWSCDWFERLDDAVEGDGAVIAAALLLASPLDSLVVRARVLLGVVRALGATTIIYVGPRPEERSPLHDGHLQFRPAHGDTPLAAALLPLVAIGESVEFLSVDVEFIPSAPLPYTSRRARLAPALGLFKNLWRFQLFAARRPNTLMLWQTSYGAGEMARSERRRGARVLTIERGRPATSILTPAVLGFERSAAIDVA